MTTRLVSIDQIAAGPVDNSPWKITFDISRESDWLGVRIVSRQIADATGGDVFEPINGLEAELADTLRRAKWPHPVQVEVVNG